MSQLRKENNELKNYRIFTNSFLSREKKESILDMFEKL